MKQCPKCQSIYTDDSLSYCLQDGAKLLTLSDSAASEVTQQMGAGGGRELPPTEILRPEDMPTARIESAPSTKEQQRARPTAINSGGSGSAGVRQTTRSNATVIALSIVVAILLIALGGLITWIALSDKNQGDARTTPSNSNQTEARQSSTPTPTARANSNATPYVTPTPQASPVDVAAAQREVQAALNGWADSIRQRNLEEHMKYYADVLEVYYNASNVGKERVRADRSAAFSKYTSLEIQLSNVKISVESSGTRATATFDKTFDFHGDKDFSGSGLNRFSFVKTGGRWLINGEKDLQTYYINK